MSTYGITANIGSHELSNGRLVDLAHVEKTYRSSAGVFRALQSIDLSVNKGEFVSIIGKSGSGKSTLINMITGIDRPTSGEVWVDHTAVHRLSEEQMALWRGRSVGIVFQFFQLLPMLTAAENVMLPMDYHASYPRVERPERAMHLLEQLGTQHLAHKLPGELSGGQQQSVAIARALANSPPLIAADEPTGNLDSQMADHVLTLFESLVDDGKTILMVTHDQDLSTRALRTVVLADGQIADEIRRS